MHRRSFFPFVFLFILSSLAFAGQNPDAPVDSFITGTNTAWIDWTRGEIVVQGTAEIPEVIRDPDDYRYQAKDYDQPRNVSQARLLAKKNAVQDALKTAASLIGNIRVSDKIKLSDAMRNATVNNKVNSYIDTKFRVRSLSTDALGCAVVLTWPLYGADGLMAMNDEPEFDDNFLNFGYEDVTNFTAASNKPPAYPGLIISAPYLMLTPALAPRVISESGRLVYDSSFVFGQDAMKTGMASYAVWPFSGGKSYFRCTALNTATFRGTDIVISDDDAKLILGNPASIEALKHCRVYIIAAEKK